MVSTMSIVATVVSKQCGFDAARELMVKAHGVACGSPSHWVNSEYLDSG